MTDRDVFKETCLPPKEAFHSKLKMDGITDDEYDHAQQMWNRHDCQTMEDYTSLYVKLDTVLLADVFEQFRRLTFDQYGLIRHTVGRWPGKVVVKYTVDLV